MSALTITAPGSVFRRLAKQLGDAMFETGDNQLGTVLVDRVVPSAQLFDDAPLVEPRSVFPRLLNEHLVAIGVRLEPLELDWIHRRLAESYPLGDSDWSVWIAAKGRSN